MGHAIAQVYAQNGFSVDLMDLNQSKLERAIKLIKSNLSILADFNKISNDEISNTLNRIKTTTDLKIPAQRANLVVEAVNEVADVKKKIFKQLDVYCSENTIFASNTSGLNIFKIVEVKKPERLVIHHWFCPAYIIPLVEIVSGPKTSSEIINLSEKLMTKLGKKPIVIQEFVDRFIVNRIQGVINVQIYEMLQKGWATPEQIDLAVKTSLGVRLPIQGVVQSQDFTGLDLILDKQKEFRMNINYPQVENLVMQGHLGVKSGKGFYEYQGRSEEAILRKRDELCLKMVEHLEKIKAFEPL